MTFTNKNITKLFVVDDHSLIFDGLRGFLSSYPEFEFVGFAENGLCVYDNCLKLQPDLIFIDLKLPGMSGIDVIRQLRQRWPEMMIIVLTASVDEKSAREALDAGANGYVIKNSPKNTLLAAIKCVARGKVFLDPSLNAKQVEALKDVSDGDIPLLTPREKQVLKLICEGLRNRDIAENLVISLKTVETHRMNLMQKLDAHNVANLIQWSQRMGMNSLSH
ncbi:two component system response regulator [uncultured Shewanella sp.]|uniref:two component system response regulator n=1 Tax=uncultured Shewanella sp. TaxID=173975 RepID=UPI0026244A30|nr:two component system response regulator [uncultured Shewanella sp.]